jgi:hypothetical protein
MAQEFGEAGGSARGWADRTVGVRHVFDATRKAFIYRVIDELDRAVS